MKRFHLAVSLFIVALLATPSQAQSYLKLKQDDAKKISGMETAIVTFTKGTVTVDLVAAVHIGDEAYYKQLNERMQAYDCLLYELLAPTKDFKPAKEDAGLDSVLYKKLLGLESQIEHIEYQKDNFVHADLTFDEFGDKLLRRSKKDLTFGLRLFSEIASGTVSELFSVGLGLVKGKNRLDFKKDMAKTLADHLETDSSAISQLLVTDRNERVMDVFAEQLKKGQKRLGIFYGAFHMPDFEAKLLDLGYKKGKTVWITAWDLSK